MAETLKPCPFCGGEADVHYFAHDDSECTVMCSNPNCRASVSARSCGSMATAYNRARKLWNRRVERTCGEWRGDPRQDAIGHAAAHEDDELWCEHCDIELDESWLYCPDCGARIEEGADE